MKKLILISLGLILLISCQENKKSKLVETESETEKINEAELVVQKILDLPKLQWIYHPELNKRLPVKVLETELINKNFNLNKFGQSVRIMSKFQLEKEGIKDFLIFNKLKIKTDTTDFELLYKIEGVGSAGRLVKENEEWIVLDYSVWEN